MNVALSATPLPDPAPVPIVNDPLWLNAYQQCLHYQARAPAIPFTIPSTGPIPASPLICARFLGYMLIEAPIDEGRTTFANEIISCNDDRDRLELARIYIQYFVRCFRNPKGRTPTPSHHPSRPSFDETKDFLRYLLEEAPRNHQTAKDKALLRDDGRCVLTGTYEYDFFQKFNRQFPQNAIYNALNCAHIFSESTNGDIELGTDKSEYAARVWAVMARFGNILITEELNGADIHRLQNIITMSSALHSYFDRLLIWFESTGQPDQYNVITQGPGFPVHPVVTFTSTNPVDLPVPDPRYLRLHAACCRVAHLSGAAEYIEKVYRDLAETLVLAKDGSTAHLLEVALSQLAVR